jgi:hypothetical protein
MSTSNDMSKEFIGFMVGLGLWVGILSFWFDPMDSVIAFWTLVIVWWALVISPLALISMLCILLAQAVFFLVKPILTLVLSCFLWLSIILVIGVCLAVAFGDPSRTGQDLQPTTAGELEGNVGRRSIEVRTEYKIQTETEAGYLQYCRRQLHRTRR